VVYAAIIDVRTPAELATGHVVGARNIDVESAGFGQAIAALPKAGHYLVYCRSGNRSAQAATTMRSAGLTVADGGCLADMEQLGYPVGR
jgi:rhodanese-related sulfurtransferase